MVEKNQINSSSVISLTLGILSILIPFIGLILGIIGVVFSRKAEKEILITDEGGRGLSTAGFICSVVGIIIQTLTLLAYISFASILYVG
ncbi:DUF4190 domain-containing protein [Paenisporosarcina sp. TG20]|uniref:DUF4190 domain-containing protein n=1 Tax=Paenisporosarcina sp. TG20 TaxID=1211706 RepID=UPI0002E37D5F|nr:DUF4190 domain-containing protein [Paenisporosarcina sp. TG20]